MSQEQLTVQIGEREYGYPEGTRYLEIAKEHQKDYDAEIILVKRDGKLQELSRVLETSCSLTFVTTRDKEGYDTYTRTAVFILLKAIFDTAGKKYSEKAVIHYSVGNGLYFTIKGMTGISQEFLQRLKEQMNEIIRQDIPISKRSLHTDEAISLFHRHHMYDKEKLFTYRRVSRVNIYSIENFDDYFYGYMAPSTGFLGLYDLVPYDEGFLLLLPARDDLSCIRMPEGRDKLFQVMKASEEWGTKVDIETVADLNERVSREGIRNIMLIQEALQEARISDIAEQIASRGDVRFVLIAGPSSSGKTSFSHRLSIQLMAHGLRPHPIEMDRYFVNREDTPLDENGQKDFESLGALDVPKFNEDMLALHAGKEVELPRFNFITGKREYNGEVLKLGAEDILVIEGIHGLNDKLSASLPEESKFKIYISALTQLNIDEHNRIPTTDGRLIRRIVRDARTRGYSAQGTIRQWQSVRRGEEKNIFPFQEQADVMFNSALVYELAVLKVYAEPLLFGVDRNSPEYVEAKRLLKFFDYVLPVPGDEVPRNSLLREFIGGSTFPV